MSVVARFEVRFTQYLDPQGEAVRALPDVARDPRALVPEYRAMVLVRALDAKAIAMQLDGNDAIAVRDVVGSALGRARAGEAAAWKREPILRLRHWLAANGAWSKAEEAALHFEV